MDQVVSGSDDFFEPSQISSLVSHGGLTLQFLKDHGFFYQENEDIGAFVDYLFREKLIRSELAHLSRFKKWLLADSRIKTILEQYPNQTNLEFPWGTTEDIYYRHTHPSDVTADRGIIAYMLGSGSKWVCCDGSQILEETGDLLYGVYRVSEHLLSAYVHRRLEIRKGGLLFVHPLLVHKATVNRSIMFGLRARD